MAGQSQREAGGRAAGPLLAEIAAICARYDLLRHPFYLRWNDGKLSQAELARYAADYRYLVAALAQVSKRAAADAAKPASGVGRPLQAWLDLHAAEEAAHVELWAGFAQATGPAPQGPATVAAKRCAQAWSADGSGGLASALAVLIALESTQPEISATKRRALERHYGFTDGPATAYFKLHEGLDHAHAALAERALCGHLAVAAPQRCGELESTAARCAERALAANWLLLDALEAERLELAFG